MAKDKLTDYSATNASNTDVGGINIDEGMLPSAVNNSLRELMTHLKNFSDGTDAIDGLSVDGAAVFNESSADVDFRVESNGSANMLFVDGGNDRIGINNASPSFLIDALGTGTGDNDDAVMRIKAQGTGDSDTFLILDSADTGESTVRLSNAGNTKAEVEWSTQTSQLNIRTASGTNGPIDMQPNNVLTARFETNGNLTLEDGNLVIGTSGHGIDFSATTNGGVSTPIELLSDYEEGTWTPTSSTNSGPAATFGSATGAYTRIGRLVHVTATIGNINDSSSTGSSELRVTGLPYTIDSHITYGSVGMDNVTFQLSRTMVVAQANTSEYVRFVQFGGGDSDTGFDYSDTDSTGSDIFFSVSYYTNQ